MGLAPCWEYRSWLFTYIIADSQEKMWECRCWSHINEVIWTRFQLKHMQRSVRDLSIVAFAD